MIETRADLITEVNSYMHRSDLASQIDTFISFVENDMNRRLRCREMVERATTAVAAGDEFIALPDDFLEMSEAYLQGNPNTALQFVTPRVLELRYTRSATAKPAYFTIIGGEVRLCPVPDSDYTVELDYYQKIPALTDSNTSNWLLASHPEIYLYGCLTQAAAFVRDKDMIANWRSIYMENVRDLTRASKRSRYGSALSVKAV